MSVYLFAVATPGRECYEETSRLTCQQHDEKENAHDIGEATKVLHRLGNGDKRQAGSTAAGDFCDGQTFLEGDVTQNGKDGKAPNDAESRIGHGSNHADLVYIFLLFGVRGVGNGSPETRRERKENLTASGGPHLYSKRDKQRQEEGVNIGQEIVPFSRLVQAHRQVFEFAAFEFAWTIISKRKG